MKFQRNIQFSTHTCIVKRITAANGCMTSFMQKELAVDDA